MYVYIFICIFDFDFDLISLLLPQANTQIYKSAEVKTGPLRTMQGSTPHKHRQIFIRKTISKVRYR